MSIMKSIVVLPTFNESGNIRELITAILDTVKDADVLVVDDDSPDGTSDIVAEMSLSSDNVHLLRRCGCRGRGLAGIAGFQYAVEKDYDYIIEMDADFSHPPEYIPSLLKEIKEHDVVIGSRFVTGAATSRVSRLRNIISVLANHYIRLVLGLRVGDCTSGFRCFRRDILASIRLNDMISTGPSIVEEVLYACHKMGYDIKEIPIEFADRRGGRTKLTLHKLLQTLFFVLKIRLRRQG